MTEQPVALLRGGVTIANPVLGGRRVISPVGLTVYPDRLTFTGTPTFGIRDVRVDARRESIQEIYPRSRDRGRAGDPRLGRVPGGL
jgi:hypothetical protein